MDGFVRVSVPTFRYYKSGRLKSNPDIFPTVLDRRSVKLLFTQARLHGKAWGKAWRILLGLLGAKAAKGGSSSRPGANWARFAGSLAAVRLTPAVATRSRAGAAGKGSYQPCCPPA